MDAITSKIYILRRFQQKKIERAIRYASKTCKEDKNSKDCKVAWDIVEELHKSKHDLNQKAQDELKSWEDMMDIEYDL
jgi:hypothetical protein